MSAGRAMSAGPSLSVRLDPLCLPVRFPTVDATADGRVRIVELHREFAVLRRSVRGVPIKVSLPIGAFFGIVMRLVPSDGMYPGTIAVMLEHRDRALSVPLFVALGANDALAEWHMWARIFGLPLFIADSDGQLHEPFRRLGAIRIFDACERLRRRSQLLRRRPSILMRRKTGWQGAGAAVYREREIIARS